ncbi:hypothetical protein [Pseudomonas sp. W5-36]|uniref:hypothetical protein n=1 Tax=Pseudomonas sp. W5-36 TaxID=3097455 RepID=UPI00397C0939
MEKARLDKTLLLLSDCTEGQFSFAELQSTLDFEAARHLASLQLVNCSVAYLDQGGYRFSWTSSIPFTASGLGLISALKAKRTHATASVVSTPKVAKANYLRYGQGF